MIFSENRCPFLDHALKQWRKLARAQRPKEHNAVREPQRKRHRAPAFELGWLPEHRDARGRQGGIAARAEEPIEIEARRQAIERILRYRSDFLVEPQHGHQLLDAGDRELKLAVERSARREAQRA